MVPEMGNIYLAELPYENHLQNGLRPVVVTQNNKGNLHGPHVHVVPLTGKMHKAHNLPTHVVIPASADNGLHKNSVALAESLRAIPKENFVYHIGKLNETELNKVLDAVKIHLGMRN